MLWLSKIFALLFFCTTVLMFEKFNDGNLEVKYKLSQKTYMELFNKDHNFGC